MDKSGLAVRSEKLNDIKNEQKLDGILALDNRGFCYYNDGFPKKNYQVHALYHLSSFFFPQQAGTVVTVEGTESITSIQQTSNEDILALRAHKTSS